LGRRGRDEFELVHDLLVARLPPSDDPPRRPAAGDPDRRADGSRRCGPDAARADRASVRLRGTACRYIDPRRRARREEPGRVGCWPDGFRGQRRTGFAPAFGPTYGRADDEWDAYDDGPLRGLRRPRRTVLPRARAQPAARMVRRAPSRVRGGLARADEGAPRRGARATRPPLPASSPRCAEGLPD